EDGIRDYKVTGVQTCALPISLVRQVDRAELDLHRSGEVVTVDGLDHRPGHARTDALDVEQDAPGLVDADRNGEGVFELHGFVLRSEERRVGKEGRAWWARDHE